MEVTLLLRGDAAQRAAEPLPRRTVEPGRGQRPGEAAGDVPGGPAALLPRAGPDCRVRVPEPAVSRASRGDGLAHPRAPRRRRGEEGERMSTVHERLRRLLFLVPYVSKHPGVTVDELAKALNVEARGPAGGAGSAHLRGPAAASTRTTTSTSTWTTIASTWTWISACPRPPRLTAGEAAALAAAAELLRPAAGDALQSALEKLERILPPAARERYREMYRKIDASSDAPAVAGAAHPGHPRAARGDVRLLQPGPARPSRGACGRTSSSATAGSGTSRASATPGRTRGCSGWIAWSTSRSRTPPSSRRRTRARAVPNPARSGRGVRVRFSSWRRPTSASASARTPGRSLDGGVEVRVAGDSERWLTQWVLSFGGEAEVLEPLGARSRCPRRPSLARILSNPWPSS